MSLGALAMEVFSEQTNSDPILVNFARSAAGFGLVAGACMPPAHASTCQQPPAIPIAEISSSGPCTGRHTDKCRRPCVPSS